MEVLESRDNRLIGRKELIVKVSHRPQGTPPRKAVREYVAKMLGVDPDVVYVRKMRTEYGMCESYARVHVYSTVERALQVEPLHVVRRNRGGGDGSRT